MKRNVTILGGGNGAWTAAAEFGLGGHDVTLYEMPQFAHSLKTVFETRTIVASGAIQGTARIKNGTSDIQEAISDAEIICIVLPTLYHRPYSELIAPFLKDGQHIVLIPGSMGTLEFAESLKQQGVQKDITISEVSVLPYSTRISGPNAVQVFGRRAELSMGVFPANRTADVLAIMNDLYPGIKPLANVLEAGLSNINPVMHCLGVVLNAGRIEYSKGEFYYYEEGMTESVCQAITKLDQERLNLADALGYRLMDVATLYQSFNYGPIGDFYQTIRGCRILCPIKGPGALSSRYLTEDVPMGLVLLVQLGHLLGVPVPLMESTVHIAGALNNENYWDTGRTLARCGLTDMSKDQLIAFAQTGQRASATIST